MKNKETAIEFLGSENVDKLKSGIVDLLLERVKEDLDCYDNYLIDIDDLVDTIYREVRNTVYENMVEKYSKEVEKRMKKALRGNSDD